MFDVARLLGDALREVKSRDGPYLLQNNIDSTANFLVGGQIRGEPPRLFDVYSEGNFIEATPDTCYFQIGESKYGKPIIDRVVTRDTSLVDATKCTLVSFDSTMRSNISVGPADRPARLRGRLAAIRLQRRIEETDPYFQMVHSAVGRGAAPGVRAAAESRLDVSARWPSASRCSTARPTASTGRVKPVAARDPAAAGAALPHADPRLFAERRAGQALPQLAAGSVRQLGRAARVPRAGRRRSTSSSTSTPT